MVACAVRLPYANPFAVTGGSDGMVLPPMPVLVGIVRFRLHIMKLQITSVADGCSPVARLVDGLKSVGILIVERKVEFVPR